MQALAARPQLAVAAARHSSPGGRPFVAAAPTAARRQGAAVCHAKVELQDLSGKVHTLDVAADETILEAAMDAGVDDSLMPYDCRMGVCLRCAAKIESGKLDQPGGMISDEAQEAGYALTCVAYCLSDVKIRVIPEDELTDVVLTAMA